MKHTLFCDIAPCSLVEIHLLSAINCFFQLQSTLFYLENDGGRSLRNDGKYPPYTQWNMPQKLYTLKIFLS